MSDAAFFVDYCHHPPLFHVQILTDKLIITEYEIKEQD